MPVHALIYLLDTNVCVDYWTGRYPAVATRLHQLSPAAVATSSVAVAELRYGAQKSQRPGENHRRLDLLLEDLPVLDFDLGALRPTAACDASSKSAAN